MAGKIDNRGTRLNPENRYERIHVEPDYEDDEAPGPRAPTLFYRDASRTILAENESPDVGFRFSLNPYRGCEHGCVYCLSGDTPILMADGTTKLLERLRPGDAVYGTRREGWYRRYVRTPVLAHWCVVKPAYRITLADGTLLIAGPDHRFLTERGWKFVTGADQGQARRPYLTENNKLMATGAFTALWAIDRDYQEGYLCGLIRGDGHVGHYRYRRKGRENGDQHQFRLAMVDGEALDRARRYLSDHGVSTHEFPFQEASSHRKAMGGIRTHARDQVERIERIIAWPENPTRQWSRGFLAGIFDAEGSFSDGTLRIANTDIGIIERTVDALRAFSIRPVVETSHRSRPVHHVRLRGGLREHLRFFHTTGPVIERKRKIEGLALKSDARLRVLSIEALNRSLPLFDITTGTGDFIANGVISHNCYARPTHEYLGFSAGLDFERRILVKEDAPELLRKTFLSPRWQPELISLSGNTDCYQPAERKLGVTRRCLEVFGEFRNPVSVVTKSALVSRDADLLAPLAELGAASVSVSVTTLDAGLARRMEPRAATPERRLEAIARLAAAGVPVVVMVAPVIPGLNDAEIPRILEAAAQAGARSAAWLLVRLARPVDELFLAWLAEHFPERRAKVEHRIRETRAGAISDSRFGRRMRGEGEYARQIAALFRAAARRHGLDQPLPPLDASHFRRPEKRGAQLRLL